jgi:hypothetical protein
VGRHWQVPASSGRHKQMLSRFRPPSGGTGSKHPGWATGIRGSPACSAFSLCPGLLHVPADPRPPPRLGCAPAGLPLPPPGGPRPGSGRGWASAPAPLRVCRAGQSSSPPVGPHRGRPVRPRPGFSWAAPGRARRLLLGRPRVIRPSQRPGHFLRDKNQLSATSLFF